MSRKQSPKSINRILKDFPELWHLYEPYSPEKAGVIFPGAEVDVKINVQRADANLLYWKPSDFGVQTRSGHLVDFVSGLSGKRLQDCMLFRKGQLTPLQGLNARSFGKDMYLQDILFGQQGVYQAVGHIATRTVTLWYEEEPSYERGFLGEPKRVEVYITLHKEPTKGQSRLFPGEEVDSWSRLAEETDVYHNVKLFGPMLLIDPDLSSIWVRELMTTVGQHAQTFERLVWRRGFGTLIDDSKKRGMSGMLGNIKVSSYVIAGRIMVQLERADARFTMIGQEDVDKPHFGISSVEGTVDEISSMVDDTILFWATADDATRTRCVHDDDAVSLG